jgi:hypothetical protein
MQNLIDNLPAIVTTILGVYEVIARAIPTIKDISIIGNIAKVLLILSDYLNKKKAA